MFANKQSAVFPGRTFYKPSGGIKWGPFLFWMLLAWAVAVAVAYGLFQLYLLGQYYVGIAPLIATLPVAGLIFLAVKNGHCRSRAIAGAAGVVAGVILYLGYFYFGMIHHLGPEAARHPEALPYYIRARMATDVLRDAHRDRDNDAKGAPKTHEVVFNWIFFAFEAVIVLGITTVAGIQRARKAYCDSCGRWMIRDVTWLPLEQTDELMEALRTGSARALAAICARPAYGSLPNLTLGAAYCPSVKESLSRDCPVFVSLKAATQAGGNPTADNFDATRGKVLLRQLQLNPDEIAALGTRFPSFEAVVGRSAVAALKPAEPGSDRAQKEAGPPAEILSVESDFAGRVLTRRTAWIGNSFAIGALLAMFASLGIGLWGAVTAFPDKGAGEVSPEKKTFGIVLIAAGLTGFAGTAIFFLVNPGYLGNRYLRKRVLAEFSRRPKCLVDPNDPEARFVEIVPKVNWGKMMLENAGDVGFLKIDSRRKEILFEGDKQRCRIPGAALLSCDLEVFVEGQNTQAATKMFYVVLRAGRPDDFWEAPLRERTGTGMFKSKKRQRLAEQLFQEIQSILPHPSQAPT